MKLKKILVCTDFSTAADLAVKRATELARSHKAAVHLVHVVPSLSWLEGLIGTKQQWSAQVRGSAATKLKELAAQVAKSAPFNVSTALVNGKASVAITQAVDEYGPDLLVLGASGEGTSSALPTALGRTAFKLVLTTKVPLLLARRTKSGSGATLAAVDLSSPSVRVARWANLIGPKGRTRYLHVFDAPFANRLKSYGVKRKTLDVYATEMQEERESELRAVLESAGVGARAEKLVLRGEAIKVIMTQVRKLKADTLVIGRQQSRKRDYEAPFGSVCRYLSYFSPTDVLIVPK